MRTRATLLSSLLFSSVAASTALAETDVERQTIASIEQLKSEFKLPSLSVAVGADNAVVFAYATGFADIEQNKAANNNTQYSVGSLAKPMTGLVLAKLVDQAKMKLDVPVSKYVSTPAYTDSFSVRELAAHLAGVPHDTRERDIAEFEQPRDHASPFDAFHAFASQPLSLAPGTGYQYSSNGYILLSAAMERAADKHYVTLMQETLWAPYGMTSTALDTSFAGKQTEATYYADINEDGSYQPSTTQRDRSFLFGGGGFISTPSDLVKGAQATYDAAFLSPSTRSQLFTPVSLRNGENNEENYSLGWRVGKLKLNAEDEQTWTALHHGGVTDKAATAYLLVVPECKASIAFATNYIPPKFWRMRGTMAKLLKAFIVPGSCRAFAVASS